MLSFCHSQPIPSHSHITLLFLGVVRRGGEAHITDLLWKKKKKQKKQRERERETEMKIQTTGSRIHAGFKRDF